MLSPEQSPLRLLLYGNLNSSPKIQPLSGNQRPDLLTSLMNMYLVLRLPRKMHLYRSIFFKGPTPANAFETPTRPSRFAPFWQGAQSPAPATQSGIWTSKSDPNMWCFQHFDLEMYFAPQRCALLNMSSYKSAPSMVCFVHFDLEMCFTTTAFTFWLLNFQKRSDTEVLCAFWLRHVLRATTACTFSTSQLPKVVQTWCVLCILTSKRASRHSGVQFLVFHLATWLRTRRFSEPTCRPSGATNHWKNTVFRDFATVSRTCIFFLLTLSLLWSSLFCSSLLWLFPPQLFHLSILSEVWLLNFLRLKITLILPLDCIWSYLQNRI